MDTAIIGQYASSKFILTEFDISRSNEASTQQSSRRKIVGKRKQTVSINLSGYLVCTSFADLENETDKLLEALNQKSLKLVIGARPDLYWLVSWSDVDLSRKPGNGGYVLPVSLSFECLEESAIRGIPALDGYVKAGSSAIDPRGSLYGPKPLPDMKTLVISVTPSSSNTTLFNHNTHTATITNLFGNAVLRYSVAGNVVATLNTPIGGTPVIVSISYDAGKTVIYANKATATVNAENSWSGYSLAVNGAAIIKYEAALNFVPTLAYVREYLSTTTADSLIKVASLLESTTIQHSSNVPTPASLIIEGTTVSCGINDFGFYSLYSGYYMFNSITSKVESNNAANIFYGSGKKTLFPYLVKGSNLITTFGTTYAYLAWQERVY